MADQSNKVFERGVGDRARSPKRTPALASRALAFWFLVPGARGLLSVTSILGKDFQTAAIGIGQMLGLMGAIALGVLLGTLITAPGQFGTVGAGNSSAGATEGAAG